VATLSIQTNNPGGFVFTPERAIRKNDPETNRNRKA
jgi:hypothetical protein